MGIEMDKPPRDMSLAELAERCGVEMGKYSRKETCDDQYCLEIFRRAMLENNERAWEILHQRFNGILLSWVRCHPNREAAYRCDSENSYVDRAFRRLWMRTKRNAALEFSTLGGALRFLRMCLNSDIVDTLRAQLRPEEMPWPEPGFPEEPGVEDRMRAMDGGRPSRASCRILVSSDWPICCTTVISNPGKLSSYVQMSLAMSVKSFV